MAKERPTSDATCTVEVTVVEPEQKLRQGHIHYRTVAGQEGSYFLELVKHISVVQASDKKLGHAPESPEQVVARAVETTERAFAEAAARGWVIPMPPFKDLLIADEGIRPGFRSGDA